MLVLLVAAAATLVSAPLVRHLMLRHGVLDVPNHRSSHDVPIARGGGWACVIGLLTGVLVAGLSDHEVSWPAVFGAIALAGLGFADDRRGLPAVPRLAAQVALGALVGGAVAGPLGALFGAVAYAVCVNVVNFMDGVNGITALSLGVWGVTALIVGREHDALGLATLGALAAGCALGFLPWNAPRARLFLGDIGSYLFGALVAGGLVVGWREGAPLALMVAPLSIYLLDTGSTLLRRARRGESLLMAHRDHIYQRLVTEAGRSHLGSAVIVGGLAAAVTAMWAFLTVTLAVVGSLLVAATYLCLPVILRGHTPRTSTRMATQ